MSKSKHKIHISKKQVIIALCVTTALLAAVGAGVGFRWWQNSQNSNPEGEQIEDRLPANVKEAQNIALSGKIDESNQKIQDQLSQPTISEQDKFDLLVQQAVNYANQNEYQKALDALKQAEAIKSEFRTSNMAGHMAFLLKNNSLAIEYFKKAITQLDPNKPMYQSEKERLEQKIKEASS